MGVRVDVDELIDTTMDLLLHMESELNREELSLALCDAWMDLEDLMMEYSDEEIIDE